ncbi:hypothetical protein Tco_0329031 [Tanacetum coccineum]
MPVSWRGNHTWIVVAAKAGVWYIKIRVVKYELVQQGPVSARSLTTLSAEKRKDIWENVKMILEGSELTKDDRNLSYNDEFEHFRQNKGETNSKDTTVGRSSSSAYPTQSQSISLTSKEPSPADNFHWPQEVHQAAKLIEEFYPNTLALLTQSKQITLPQLTINLELRLMQGTKLWFKTRKLWFKIPEDTMRLIKEDHFRETMQEEMHVNVQGQSDFKIQTTSRTRMPNGKLRRVEQCWMNEPSVFFLAGEHVTNVDDDVDDSPENDLALNVDHVFEADECDAFDSDVDEGPTTQTMFMTNLTSEDPIYDEAGPSYDSNNPFEVQDHDTFVDHMDEYQNSRDAKRCTTQLRFVDSDTYYRVIVILFPYVSM